MRFTSTSVEPVRIGITGNQAILEILQTDWDNATHGNRWRLQLTR